MIGLLVATGFCLRTAASACSLLLAVFFSLMVRAFVNHQEIGCGCFGPGDSSPGRPSSRDGSLLAALAGRHRFAFMRKTEGGDAETLKRK